jgi:outer membrane protein assembly factor BamB
MVWNDKVYIISGDGYIYALECETGELYWKIRQGTPGRNNWQLDFHTRSGETIVAWHHSNSLCGIGVKTGVKLWQLDKVGLGSEPPSIADGKIYFYYRHPRLQIVVVDLASGTIIRRIPVEGIGKVDISEDSVYLSGKGKITAYRRDLLE